MSYIDFCRGGKGKLQPGLLDAVSHRMGSVYCVYIDHFDMESKLKHADRVRWIKKNAGLASRILMEV